MGRQDFPVKGTCRCGRTSFEISAPPLATAACHCRGCQQMSSSAYSLSAIMPAPAFRVSEGTPEKGGLQGPRADHFFCPHCKTWMFTRIPGYDDIVNVRSTLLEDLGWSEPFIETMTAEKLPWAQTPAKHSFEGFPELDVLPKLIEEFARTRHA
ncbi:GFA family protein [Roseibium salinum]|uniref:GFA family protein n=1 Tax=Roseibium salinum TaxID=1604349 RepID=A0ABT3QYZ2_9HYPH|nr:GFA family protein [Roseibium sp. DSM 29163]MCX2722173.1 GFA family protein [Roseibium sp. DSM 29163]